MAIIVPENYYKRILLITYQEGWRLYV